MRPKPPPRTSSSRASQRIRYGPISLGDGSTGRIADIHRRLARDHETLPARSEAVIHLAMTDLMARRLTGGPII